jgi:hypothetical protein
VTTTTTTTTQASAGDPATALPDPLVFADGSPVRTPDDWARRRREILRLFEDHVYGRTPTVSVGVRYDVFEENPAALDGLARRRQVRLTFSGPGGSLSAELLLHTPAAARGPVPCFLGLNFQGNHAVHPDPAIPVTTGWVRNSVERGVTDHRATEANRGANARAWPIELIVRAGFGVATVYCGDFDPDDDDGFRNGVHGLIEPRAAAANHQESSPPRAPDAWGTIGGWAWGLSRALDYLQTDPHVDGARVAAIGHSRLGKTALWAAAQDERFAMAISNDSGCGGAALHRHAAENRETIAAINRGFPHWFCLRFREYNNGESRLPVDQHQLLSLIAPRPLYVASAAEDLWACPPAEFASLVGADPVYRLLGTTGLEDHTSPAPGRDIAGVLSYHIRPGKHAIVPYDWERYVPVAARHLLR